MNYEPKKIAALLVALGLLAAGCQAANQSPGYTTPLKVGGTKIFVKVAKSDEEKRQGLSGQEKLRDEQGMLFDFTQEAEARPGFWMKEMKFDLDLIWIKKNPSTGSGRIIGITANVPSPKNADDKLPLYSPPSPIDMVLEVTAGWSERHKVKVGDEVEFVN
jgi:uncharacterized membrane protein (UPF0127 family)